ncbi:MAG: M3 family oligoendopeptidase [Bacteroidetes bacterium]|nr:M3 family oligoendopeptidase [Bacteroidota bacterium]
MTDTLHIPAPVRHFLPADFKVTDFAALEPWFRQLLDRPLHSVADLQQWLKDWNELDNIIDEDIAWRYIRMTCNTLDEDIRKAYQYFVSEIQPRLSPLYNQLEKKYYECPFRNQLQGSAYRVFDRGVAKSIELFREENVPLQSEDSLTSQEYDAIMGEMTVQLDGEELTMQQAGKLLQEHDRGLRERIFDLMAQRRLQEKDRIDEIFDKLVDLRTRIARNAGFDSYTDYKFKAMGRFDYTRADTHAFHDAVAEIVTPLCTELLRERQQRMKLDTLRPWDTALDIYGEKPLQPFQAPDELLQKSIAVLSKLRPVLGQMIATMNEMGQLDLGSRKGKAPGGYNYPLAETGVPFIFMNAVGTQGDLTTMVHEAGHAIHSFVTRDLELGFFKNTPSEIAELASMSMELISMDHWDEFYTDAGELRRAKIDQLTRCITILPWIATVDAFQQWVYDHPGHSRAARCDAWERIYGRFHDPIVDWSGYEELRRYRWHQQGHIFDVPFYYIEYGIAQLGALQMWMQYKQHPAQGLDRYLAALKLGYTDTIPNVYAAGGISFGFGAEQMRRLFEFAGAELQALKQAA